MADAWLMLAFPGDDTGKYALRAFAPAKNGKSWYRKLRTRDQAIAAKRELVAAGIPYKCVKVEDDGRAPRKPQDNVVELPRTSKSSGYTAAPRRSYRGRHIG